MTATFGQTCGSRGFQAKMMASTRIEGMVIARLTEIGKEAGTQGGIEVLNIIDATAIGTLRVNMEHGARDLEEAEMSHLGRVMKVAQKKEESRVMRPPSFETGGTKIREGTVYQSGTGIGEPKRIWIPNGWMRWSQRIRTRGTQKMI